MKKIGSLHGQSLVEVAILIPVALILLMGFLDFGEGNLLLLFHLERGS